MKVNFGVFFIIHSLGDSATRPPAPHSPHHAVLPLLAGTSPRRRRALPGTVSAALASTFNYRF